jgi:hypothetical protein
VRTATLIGVLVVLGLSYGLLDLGFPPGRRLWAVGMYAALVGWFALAGALVGTVLWALERAFPGRRRRPAGPNDLRLYAAIGAMFTWGLLVFRIYAYAPRIEALGG